MQNPEYLASQLTPRNRAERRSKQLLALKNSAGAWNEKEHPELAAGGATYVEAIRAERDDRFDDAIRSNQVSSD